MNRPLLSIGFLVCITSAGHSAPDTGQVSPLLHAQLLTRFTSWNPRLQELEVLQVMERSAADSTLRSVFLLMRAVRADHLFEADFRDEAFGVFVVNRDTDTIDETLGFVPTCRWRDCEARIAETWRDSVRIEWQGETYRDAGDSRVFQVSGRVDWRIEPGTRVGAISPSTSAEELTRIFGTSNVEDADIYIGEGYCTPGTVVLPHSPNRLEITWQDEERTRVAEVRVVGRGSDWQTASGVRLGSTLAQLEHLRGAPLSFSGFGWDYGGGAAWEEKSLDNQGRGTSGSSEIVLQLTYDRNAETVLDDPEAARAVHGDHLIRSDHPVIRRMTIWVGRMTVIWGTARSEIFCG